jgi:hypothetical protein
MHADNIFEYLKYAIVMFILAVILSYGFYQMKIADQTSDNVINDVHKTEVDIENSTVNQFDSKVVGATDVLAALNKYQNRFKMYVYSENVDTKVDGVNTPNDSLKRDILKSNSYYAILMSSNRETVTGILFIDSKLAQNNIDSSLISDGDYGQLFTVSNDVITFFLNNGTLRTPYNFRSLRDSNNSYIYQCGPYLETDRTIYSSKMRFIFSKRGNSLSIDKIMVG